MRFQPTVLRLRSELALRHEGTGPTVHDCERYFINSTAAEPRGVGSVNKDGLEYFMKKANTASDELRSEYRREDFGPMVRGKYAARLRESSNIVVLDPEIAEVFPNAKAVNAALRGLLELARTSARLSPQSIPMPAQAMRP